MSPALVEAHRRFDELVRRAAAPLLRRRVAPARREEPRATGRRYGKNPDRELREWVLSQFPPRAARLAR